MRYEINIITGEKLELPDLPPSGIVEDKVYQPLSAWQVRKVLNQFGLRDAVENAVKSSNDIVVKDAWNFANEFYRDNEVLINMAYSLGMTDDQLDEMYDIGITL